MKSLFSRLKSAQQPSGPSTSSSTRPQSSQSHLKDKENFPSSDPLPPKKKSTSTFSFHKSSRETQSLRSPTPLTAQRAGTLSPPSAIANGSKSTRPRSVNAISPLPTLTVDDGENMGSGPVVGSWEEEIARTRAVSASSHNGTGGEGVGLGLGMGPVNGAGGDKKKVTFRSPVPTPTASVILDEAEDLGDLGEDDDDRRDRGPSQAATNGRIASTSPSKRTSALRPLTLVPPPPSSSSRPSSSQSMISSRPRPSSRQSSPLLPSFTPRPPQTRKASLPPLSTPFHNTPQTHSRPLTASPSKSMMLLSPTPTEGSTSAASTRSYLALPNSWSEMAGEELIANLGPKERTRQEVLWEIVSSEERYVQDLIQLNETFCKQLLPPSATSPHLDFLDHSSALSRTLTMSPSSASPALSGESLVNLPIAARYASTGRNSITDVRHPSDSSVSTAPPMTPNDDQLARGVASHPPPSTTTTARMNAYNILTNGRPSEPNRKSSFLSLQNGRSHHSLPPPSRNGSGPRQSSAMGNYARMSFHPGSHNKLHKPHDGSRNSSGASVGGKDVQLPEDLEKVLTVLAGGIVEGHIKLAAALRRRYDNQYPLVRSLADVFTAHSYILREYGTYVLHLEKALSQVHDALGIFSDPAHPHSAKPAKRLSRRMEESDLGQLGRVLLSLEELAAERGESGLIISLSKPFQRLLKYPLLFQNLLFNTDPSLREYEATLAMVDEVETIVRQIEDDKSSFEEREKTRDVWARIEGLEKDQTLMAPKSNRMLLSETELPVPDNVQLKVQKEASINRKKSFRRFSDMMKGHSGNNDLWIVRFSDVSLLCERTGTTQLPVSIVQKTSRSESLTDLGNKAKHTSGGKRSSSGRARNLYKFVKVHQWHSQPQPTSTDSVLKNAEPSRTRPRPRESAPRSPPRRRSGLPSIPGTPHATPTKVALKTADGSGPMRPSPAKSVARDDDTDTVVSDGMSEMSFAFHGSDEIRPIARKSVPRGSTGSSVTKSRSTSVAGTGRPGATAGLQRRSSGGHVSGSAADAKFAHRLRSTEDGHPSGDGARTVNRARRSLPPAMVMASKSPSMNANATGSVRGAMNRPAWNSGLSTTTTTTSKRASTPVSSIRGARSPVIASVPAPVSTPPASSVGSRRTSTQSQLVKKSTSTDSGVAGLWKAYGEGEGLGLGTPVKVLAPPTRSVANGTRTLSTSTKNGTPGSTSVTPVSAISARKDGISTSSTTGSSRVGMRSSRSSVGRVVSSQKSTGMTNAANVGTGASTNTRKRELGGKV
ncbi:hypothetical protein CI109_100821 [Kwoniella shandongensis]|uniref:Uncharacterized protein n=1 Tax=Kwoniella shandongensis TaxID=1734106 RepID=A0A5M6BPD8_9TREE|nr:uncharacterized protein CI109_006910 [Kwoniella shandongensis]KAA5524756.1 hypothetical protein CI109_006910 [Kwoniella shandongensis]